MKSPPANWYTIASDRFGPGNAHPHLLGGTKIIRFSAEHLEESLRHVATGNSIVFGYADLDPNAQYKLRLRFICDTGGREQRIQVNGQILKHWFQLPREKRVEHILDVPQELANRTELTVEIQGRFGAQAVVSQCELLSSHEQSVSPQPPLDAQEESKDQLTLNHIPPPPRLSPLPENVHGQAAQRLPLDGIWNFAALQQNTRQATLPSPNPSSTIQVPGEWALQGFEITDDQLAAYSRDFEIPADWCNHRVKLRFHTVYGTCRVQVNDRDVGGHEGTFTPFELDITDAVHCGGSNRLEVTVTPESLADQLSSGSRYAVHPLGGILRSVFLMALPERHLSDLQVETSFDSAYRNARLKIRTRVCNEGKVTLASGRLAFRLRHFEDDQAILLGIHELPDIDAGEAAEAVVEFAIDEPAQWDCENPALYALTTGLYAEDGGDIETVTQRIGFRQIEVRKSRVFLNGHPFKIRGVNLHHSHPLTGRVVSAELLRRDVELFREANVNHLRTSHYPPDEALLEACDEMGMFVECEAPHCWSQVAEKAPGEKYTQDEKYDQIIRSCQEMVVAYRNHPCILFWSIANESMWDDVYDAASRVVRDLDPSRPRTFGHWHTMQDAHINEISSAHYKGYQGIEAFRDHPRPVNYGEFAHLNAYNRFELATDPGLRAQWGRYLSRLWNMMYDAEEIFGGSIWSGIDDTFFWDARSPDGTVEKRTVGYGAWGVIDGWRRRKPEWWEVKQAFSPVWIPPGARAQREGEQLKIRIQNRQFFSDLNRLLISWELGDARGEIRCDVAPGAWGDMMIPVEVPIDSTDVLHLHIQDPRGFTVNDYALALESPEANPPPLPQEGNMPQITESAGQIVVSSDAGVMSIDRVSGLFTQAGNGRGDHLLRGPQLLVLPLNGDGEVQTKGPAKDYPLMTATCTHWQADSVETDLSDGLPVVRVRGAYAEAKGRFTYTFLRGGACRIQYDFTWTAEDCNPRQVGLVFELPGDCDRLEWTGRGFWSTYPSDHPGRPRGTARAFDGIEASLLGPRNDPQDHPWSLDLYTGGSNDFRSTKMNIQQASLTDAHGCGLGVYANWDRHVRAWISEGTAHLLVAHYSNGGGERYLRALASIDDQPLHRGDCVQGDAVISLISPSLFLKDVL